MPLPLVDLLILSGITALGERQRAAEASGGSARHGQRQLPTYRLPDLQGGSVGGPRRASVRARRERKIIKSRGSFVSRFFSKPRCRDVRCLLHFLSRKLRTDTLFERDWLIRGCGNQKKGKRACKLMIGPTLHRMKEPSHWLEYHVMLLTLMA